jgi:hypothetical protein
MTFGRVVVFSAIRRALQGSVAAIARASDTFPSSRARAEKWNAKIEKTNAPSRALEPTKLFPDHHKVIHSIAQDGNVKGDAMNTAVSVLSFDRVNAIYNVALVALVIGGLVSIVATTTLIWATDAKNRFTSAHIASVRAQSDQAKAEAARASERMAELLLQTQQSRLEQEKIRLEHEQVRNLNAWRRVSPEQHDKIVKALRGHSLIINVLTSSNDPEAAQFGQDIVKTLKDSGASINSAASMFDIPISGLGMTMTKSSEGTALYMALRGAGFDVKDLPERDPVMIVVGSKPSPF